MKREAKARTIKGVQYANPIAFVVAGGFTAENASAVINAYKDFYTKGMAHGDDHWLDHVTSKTGVDEVTATAIMRRYRQFYGK